MIRKFLILVVGLILLAGWFSTAWGHGPKGFNPGFRNFGFNPAQPGLKVFPRLHQNRSRAFPPVLKPRYHAPKYLSRIGIPRPDPLSKKIARKRLRRFIRQGLGRQGFNPTFKRNKAPIVTPSPGLQSNHPESDPWFLYGKGKILRQMGILPGGNSSHQ